jgi:hypothetical protein
MNVFEVVVSILSGGAIFTAFAAWYDTRQNLQATRQQAHRDYLIDRYNQLVDIFAEVETFLDCGMTSRHVNSKTQDEMHQLGVFNFYIWKAKGLLLSIGEEELKESAEKLIVASRGEIPDGKRLCEVFSLESRQINRTSFIQSLERLTELIEGASPGGHRKLRKGLWRF